MPPYLIHPTQMHRRGLRLVNIDDVKQNRRLYKTNIGDFKSIFGKHPVHLCCRVWRDLQTQPIDNRMTFEEARTKDAFEGFMYANNFLRTYSSSVRLQAALFNGCDKARLGRLKWVYIAKIQSLKAVKIVWPDHWDETFIGSVDGSHTQTTKLRDPVYRKNTKNYSHKFHSPGRNHEIVLDLWRNCCVLAKASDPGSVSDITAYHEVLKALVPPGKRLICDKGYITHRYGDNHILAFPNSLDSPAVQEFKREARARHKSFNARLKIYKCLSTRFTQGIDKLQMCFDAVVVLVQYSIEDTGPEGEPLMLL